VPITATGWFLAAAALAAAAAEPQAMSLLGKPLYAPEPSAEALANLEAAREDYRQAPGNADAIVWLGRRIAYTGDYRGAIEMFSEGIRKHPDDARFYRHRGHRYISVRDFDRAIADLARAAGLIEGTENEVEPDGLPNALGIPVSTLHGNIWYHLGLAHYLKHDWDAALSAYDRAFASGDNDDNRVSTTHWRYMILRRMGRHDEARAALDVISTDMNVIENFGYYDLCLFYKGEKTFDDLFAANEDTPGGSAVGYGLANWLMVEGETGRGRAMLADLAANDGWSAFGVIAAEADLAALAD